MEKRTAEAIQLEKEIREHDHSYWVLHKPLINDVVYDQIVNRLLKIEPDNEYLKKIHTPKVDSSGKVTHIVKMLSLDKAYGYDEVVKWAKKLARTADEKFRIMPKLDGVSGQLKEGVLATRGDGEIGEDITHKLSFMNILTKGDPEDMITEGDPKDMRGEILFTKSKFQQIKGVITRKSGEDYKNERNAVGGVLTRDDIEPVKILTFVDFEYTYEDLDFAQLENLGEEGWNGFIEEVKDMNFPTDGIVIKVLDPEYAESLGATRHHLKSAIAFKFENLFEWSVLREVEFSPGKHDITPVGKIDPVEISGASIASPSLHNWKNILDRDLHIGDLVKVERAGDVIPYISDSKPGDNRTPIVIPPCPVCGSELSYEDPQLVCSNNECGGKLLNKLCDAVVRIGIDRLGKPTIKKMMDNLGVETLVDIFNLTLAQIESMPGFGKTSANNLYYEISKVKGLGVYEWQLLAALNIPGIGRSLSKDLLAERNLMELSGMNITELTNLPSIGEERGLAIIKGIFDNYQLLHDLGQILPIKKEEVVEVSGDAIKVCFTGKFPEKKSYYYDLLKEKGGYEIMNKVNKDTQMLVVADPTKESNKTKAAKKKGIKIVGIDELI
jgi:DNA ligase (NAD+)